MIGFISLYGGIVLVLYPYIRVLYMDIKEIRRVYGISNLELSRVMGYSSLRSYSKSAGKRRVEGLLEWFVNSKLNG